LARLEAVNVNVHRYAHHGIKLGLTIALGQISFTGCATSIPERAPLTVTFENLAREEEQPGETRWNYIVVIENAGRMPATLIQETVTLGWDGVHLSPSSERTSRAVMGRSTLRLPRTSVFRRSDFEASSSGSPGRSANAPQRAEGMWIYWQFVGRYEEGGAILLNADLFPGRR